MFEKLKQQDITILIPTHNRQQYLRRVMDYYAFHNLEWPIIICDSSTQAFDDKFGHSNVQYLHSPDSDYTNKMVDGMRFLKTKYCVMCADKDFIVPRIIEIGVRFLNENPDYSSVQGKQLGFICEKSIKWRPLYQYNCQMNVNSDDQSLRLLEQFTPYMHQFYSVHRSENLRQVFAYSSDRNCHMGVIEILVAMIAAINGKHKILSCFYSARELMSLSTSSGSKWVGMGEILTNPIYESERRNFIDIVSTHLVKKGVLNKENARKAVLNALDVYLSEFIPQNRMQSGFARIKSLSESVFPPKVLTFLRRIYREVSLSPKDGKTIERHFREFDDQAKIDLELIHKCIIDHVHGM